MAEQLLLDYENLITFIDELNEPIKQNYEVILNERLKPYYNNLKSLPNITDEQISSYRDKFNFIKSLMHDAKNLTISELKSRLDANTSLPLYGYGYAIVPQEHLQQIISTFVEITKFI